LVAGYAAPYEPPRDPGPERHVDVSRPGEPVGIDCFYVGRLRGTEGKVWQLTAIDVASSFGWAELVVAKQGNPIGRQTSKLARRVAAHLETAGWRLERLLSDNGNEFKGVHQDGERPGRPPHPHPRRSDRRPTATSRRCTGRSSMSVGDLPLPATYSLV
jgi:hypothetical protein